MDEQATNAPPITWAKVPEVTLGFWIIKVAATTLGETGGDALSMSMGWGYLDATLFLTLIFLLFVTAQVRAKRYHAGLFWATIVATTTVGTTLADYADRSLGLGYAGGSSLLLALLLLSLFIWWRVMGSIAISSISNRKAETCFWVTIMFSQTLGTALGDWTTDSLGMGYAGGALVFATLLLLVAAAYFWTEVSRTTLFWIAFILTRPLGAASGDFLDKPIAAGGLALSRYTASAALLCFIVVCVLAFRLRPANTHSRG